jgi:hypothetical protein
MRILPLLALLPLPLAPTLTWHVQVASCSKYAPVEFQAQLLNASKEKMEFRAEGDRPQVELILEPEGKPPVRKPLPKEANAYKGPAELEPSQAAWFLRGDLRRAFGRLPPGRYSLRAAHGENVSAPAAFEVLDTSIEEARKNSAGVEGIEFQVAGGVGVLVNRRARPLALLAYGKKTPLDALVTAQQWTGRAWTRSPGLFCGTGLEEVVVAPGERREIALPPLPDGILRLAVSCVDRSPEGPVSVEALSDPILVDTFKE